MRLFLACTISAAVHAAVLGLMALPMLPDRPPHFEIARGQPVTLQVTMAAAPSQPEAVPIHMEPLTDTSPPLEKTVEELLEPAATAVARQAVSTTADTFAPPAADIDRSADSAPETAVPVVKHQQAQPIVETEVTAVVERARPPTPEPPAQAVAAVPLVASEATGAQVDQLPEPLPANSPPAYPLDALLSGAEGRVLLRVAVSAQGQVDEAEIHTSSGFNSLDQAALTAVLRWRFRAALRGGLPVAHEVLVPVRFSIRRG